MMKKLMKVSLLAVITAAGMVSPQKSVAACGDGCTFIAYVCPLQGPCFPNRTLYAVVNCNGQQVLCPIGCCG